MRNVGLIAAQVVLSVLIAGPILPMVLYYTPALTRSAIGPWLPFLIVGVLFVVLRMVWPRRNPVK